MNLDTWNSLPTPVQDVMMDSLAELGPKYSQKFDDLRIRSLEGLVAGGVEVITFTGGDKEWFLSKLAESAYNDYAGKAPVDGPKLYELLQKK